jgi:putative two-component system response regulator
LLKTGSLNEDEWEVMKKHPVIGAEILRGSDAEFIQMAETIALTHHEKWDGSGYPQGLRGSEIPLTGRIAALADAFDALTSTRPYRKALPVAEALEIIKQGRGNHFDPDVVDAFLAITDEILAIRDSYQDEQESQLVRMIQGI